ncbi:MAG TPA: DoxX family protein [Bryobacteraceae bacterium]|jgi:hypothetical protein|nr:DoxX family protein [Bryobacteraceae bacterium]
MPKETTRGKQTVAAICAYLMALLFLVSGGWKVLSPFKTGELLEQAKVPAGLGVPGASVLGTIELFAAILLLLPQLRRWGGLLGSALIIFFLGWIGYYYHALVGQECSCFPIIKRTIGPGFFISDGVMLLLCAVASLWSPPAPAVRRLRVPVMLFVVLAALAGVSFGVNAAERSSSHLPNPVIVDGKPENLAVGKTFLFFYDPSCEHCDAASRFMSTLNWGDTHIVAIPTVNPQWAESFLHDTKLKASTSLETAKLKAAFPFVDPPFGVALEDGKQLETFGQAQFTPPLPAAELKKLGFVH